MTTNEFKIICIGDAGVGKSAWIKKICTGEFTKEYQPTFEIENYYLDLSTNIGKIIFNMFDTSGQNHNILPDIDYSTANAFICFFDLTNKLSYKSVLRRIKKIQMVSKAPIVLVGNKVDIKERKISRNYINLHDVGYFDISAKSNFQYKKPLLYILHTLIGNHVCFV